jgi:hypothetical protein
MENSIIIGDSPNRGEAEVFNGEEVSIGRSFPFGTSK